MRAVRIMVLAIGLLTSGCLGQVEPANETTSVLARKHARAGCAALKHVPNRAAILNPLAEVARLDSRYRYLSEIAYDLHTMFDDPPAYVPYMPDAEDDYVVDYGKRQSHQRAYDLQVKQWQHNVQQLLVQVASLCVDHIPELADGDGS